ncbi:MAG: hypothetical protein HY588_02420, partial [Candidatus Omnitrophica bacterium]|nr:hypothetical protein [Candidatus Omnitrophota bacterium]
MSTRILQIVLILLVGSFQRLALAETPDGNSCVSCHSDIWEEVSASIHSQQGVFCQDCHGGNPAIADKDLAKAAGTGYIGIPDKAQIAKTCGECHADVEKMNFYGIRTDQL